MKSMGYYMYRVRDWLDNLLAFFGLTDHEGNLSISNILVMAFILLVAFLPSVHTTIGFVISIFNYIHKRHYINLANDQQDYDALQKAYNCHIAEHEALDDRVHAIEATDTAMMAHIEQHQALADRMTRVETMHASVAKQADDVRAALQASNLATAINLPRSFPRMK